jgi:hypothetical protein
LLAVPFWERSRFKKGCVLAILAATALLRALAGFLLLSFVPDGHLWLDVYVVIHICVLLAVLHFCFKAHIAQSLYTILLMVMLGTCANCIAYIAVEPFLPDRGSFLVAEPFWWIANALAIAAAFPFVYRIFSGLLRHMLYALPAKSVFSLCIAPIAFYIMASLYVVLMGAFSSMFIAFVAVFAGLALTYTQLRVIRSIRDLHVQEIKTQSLLQNYEQIDAHFHEINRLKHDMRSHLSMLRLFLKDNRTEEAQNYLKIYADEVEGITPAAYHENYLVNAVAHDVLLRSRMIGAKAELNLKASPLRISEPDLISLLTNITDNALEACAKMPEGRERFITFSITKRDPYLAIACENSNPGGIVTDTDGKILSSKSEIGHGYGLKTIARIAAAYKGMVEITHDENVFAVAVALKDMQKDPVQE